MLSLGVVPARFRSSRFPGKPLALIAGKPLVQRVYERARSAQRLTRLMVATDDERIRRAVEEFGGEVVMTSPEHASGTDRLAEVARRFPADIYVNIQGDEPLVEPADVDALIECLASEKGVDMVTLKEPLTDAETADDPNVVKVVCDEAGRALYFSRSRIPHRHPQAGTSGAEGPWFRHVGLYAYRGGFLQEFASWGHGTLEDVEGLEQLRVLERGRTIRVLGARGHYLGVDAPEDVTAVERALES
ncbi:MAG: 3-deoxy-manno-octulosonate cytidylyltransferase [Acidobacteria bacterium]|nr:3-deoxy-manno-octulosonate cytidylyltransferase [Acidobacteriota bacterium]